jgi:hypothetical protein
VIGAVKNTVNAEVVEAAREMLRRAEAGEIFYAVIFSKKIGEECSFVEAGEVEARDVFFMTECWRHDYLRETHEAWEGRNR